MNNQYLYNSSPPDYDFFAFAYKHPENENNNPRPSAPFESYPAPSNNNNNNNNNGDLIDLRDSYTPADDDDVSEITTTPILTNSSNNSNNNMVTEFPSDVPITPEFVATQQRILEECHRRRNYNKKQQQQQQQENENDRTIVTTTTNLNNTTNTTTNIDIDNPALTSELVLSQQRILDECHYRHYNKERNYSNNSNDNNNNNNSSSRDNVTTSYQYGYDTSIHPKKMIMKQIRPYKTAVGAASGAVIGGIVTAPIFPVGMLLGGIAGGVATKQICKVGEKRAQQKWEQYNFQRGTTLSPIANHLRNNEEGTGLV